HLPYGHSTCIAVAEQDVGLAVTIVISCAVDLPIRGHRPHADRRRHLPVLHFPDRYRAGVAVTPEEIGGAVAIEIANAGNAPIKRDIAQAHARLHLTAIHL